MALILASSSPRRRELLNKITTDFIVQSAEIDETIPVNMSPTDYVSLMAREKAKAIYLKNPNDLIIGSDTIVVCENKILGKPKNSQEAKETLQMLSGQTHLVYTSVCVMAAEKTEQELVVAEVDFFDLNEMEIDKYLATGEHADKAGSYGIQGQGALFVKSIKGDYYAIVGFPVAYVSRLLEKFT